MFNQFFALSDGLLFMGFAVTYTLSGLLIYWIFKALAFFKSSKVILKAPGVFAIPTHLFALSSAFLGVAVWENFNHHFDAVSKEGEALVAYVNYVESVPSIRDSNLISSAQAYVKSATNEEWKMIATDKRRDPNTDLLMRDLISKTLLAASNPNLSNPIASGLIQVTCPGIFRPKAFRDNDSFNLRSRYEESTVFRRTDCSDIARGRSFANSRGC